MPAKSTVAKAPITGEQPPAQGDSTPPANGEGSSTAVDATTGQPGQTGAPPDTAAADLSDRQRASEEIDGSLRAGKVPDRAVFIRAGASEEQSYEVVAKLTRLLALQWESAGKVRDPGGEWREPTVEEKSFFEDQVERDARFEQVGKLAPWEEGAVVGQADPLRELVELIKRNNREILRLTGHLPTVELQDVEKAMDELVIRTAQEENIVG